MPNDPPAVVDAETARKKKQLVIVAILLAGLVIALYMQPTDEPETQRATTQPPVTLAVFDSNPPVARIERREQLVSSHQLSRVEIDRILQTELFHEPETQQEPEQPEKIVESAPGPPPLKVHAIYGSGTATESTQGTGHRVLMGREIARPGEVLPDGRQIVRVTADGVEIAR